MSSIRTLVDRAVILGIGGVLCGSLAACSGNPTGNLLASSGLGPKTAQSQDFVVNSRPASVDYIPINPAEPGRTTPAKTAEQVKAVEEELDGVRERNAAAGAVAAQAGGTPPPDPVLIPAKKTKSKASSTKTQ
jgi:hypothetical protein